MKTSSGRIKRNRDIPDDLIATSSKASPILPKVMIEASRIPRGRARGTIVELMKKSSFRIVHTPKPLPSNSSIYSQKNCITSTKSDTKNVTINGPIKERIMSMSSFLSKLIGLAGKPTYEKVNAMLGNRNTVTTRIVRGQSRPTKNARHMGRH